MIAVTGANGKLGRHVIEGLLKIIPAKEIVAIVRNPAKSQDLASLGIQLRTADYAKPETLTAAFEGATKVLLISGNEVGQRIPQHQAVVDAAKHAGASLIGYTSVLHAQETTLSLAPEHKATELYIQSSGIPYILLRNGWYLENHTENLAPALEHGVILGAAADGRFASATRADYAAAAVHVLTTEGHANKIYELAGDTAYTLTQLAAEVSAQSGNVVLYKNLPEQEFARALAGFGLPAPVAEMLAAADSGAANGELDDSTHTLSRLIGRPTTTLNTTVGVALKS